MNRLYRLLKRLQKLKTTHPVRIKIVKPHEARNLWGDCNFTGKEFVIRLVKDHVSIMMLILVHEYAHTLAWHNVIEDHGDEFGIAYAHCWRIYCGEVN
jgi:predicted metal-dependent hydrolase